MRRSRERDSCSMNDSAAMAVRDGGDPLTAVNQDGGNAFAVGVRWPGAMLARPTFRPIVS
jgi:hypothetical protein